MKRITAVLLLLAAALTALTMSACSIGTNAQAAPLSTQATVAATQAPTSAPTSAPTAAPTQAPAVAPTQAPTTPHIEPMKPTEPREPLRPIAPPVVNTPTQVVYYNTTTADNSGTTGNAPSDDNSRIKSESSVSAQSTGNESGFSGSTYNDPKNIIRFAVPQAWQDYCAVDTATENGVYKITIRMKKLYNDESVPQGIVCLNVYDKAKGIRHGFSDPVASNSRYEVYDSAFGEPPVLSDEEWSAKDCVEEALSSVKLITE